MKLLSPDVYQKLFADKDLNEIIKEKKRIETKITMVEAARNPMINTGGLFEKKNETPGAPVEEPIEVKGTGNEADMITVNADGEHSELSIYMSYSKMLTELINQKNEYMDEANFKAKINAMDNQTMMDVRNKLVEDINFYYKETNSMRTKEMLYSIPFLKFLVKNKAVNENVDNLEVILKKEEYVKYIDGILDTVKQKEVEEKQKQIAENGK